MTKHEFKPVPLSKGEKSKIAENFIKSADYTSIENEQTKSKLYNIHIRVPESVKNDIEAIHSITGFTQNSICVQALLPGLKAILKRLKDDNETP